MAELQMDTLGAPRVVTGSDYMDALARLGWNKENMMSDLPTVTKVASSLTSFMDQQYNQALNYQKAKTDMAETVARTGYLGAQTDQIQQELPLRLKQMDIDNQTRQNTLDYNNQTLEDRVQQQKLTTQQLKNNVDHQQKSFDLSDTEHEQQNQIRAYTLDDLKNQQQRDQQATDDLPSALSDIPDPHDLNYEDELANFYKNHPNAATNPKTRDQIQNRLKQNELTRSTLSSYQEQNNTTKQLQELKVTGDVPMSTDIDRLKQNPDDAHQVISRGNVTRSVRQAQELISQIPNDAPADVKAAAADLQNLINNGTDILSSQDGMNLVRSGAKSVLYDANGNLNPKLQGELQMLQNFNEMRIKQGLGKASTGKVTLVAPHKVGEKEPSRVEVENVPLSQIPQITAHPETYFPQTPEQRSGVQETPEAKANRVESSVGDVLQKNPDVQALLDKATGTNTTEDWNAYLKALKSKLPSQNSSTAPPDKPRGTSSSENASSPTTQPVSYNPNTDMDGRLRPSNNAYIAPRGAADVAGIDANVWQNVMSEEGPEFGKDGTHDSVFGLWRDAAGSHEREAYNAVAQNGAHSLAAYNAVTHGWVKQFLGESQPWRLQSPGLQEMVIADSQHRGGQSARNIIDRMGGWDAVNQMDPVRAINMYSELRKPLWPGNNTPFRDGATDRVTRERAWALRNNGILSGNATTHPVDVNPPAGGQIMQNPVDVNPRGNVIVQI